MTRIKDYEGTIAFCNAITGQLTPQWEALQIVKDVNRYPTCTYT